MVRTIPPASSLTLGNARAAPSLVGGGENSHVGYGGAPGGRLFGGGRVALTGGGVERCHGSADLEPQPGRAALLGAGGDEARRI